MGSYLHCRPPLGEEANTVVGSLFLRLLVCVCARLSFGVVLQNNQMHSGLRQVLVGVLVADDSC